MAVWNSQDPKKWVREDGLSLTISNNTQINLDGSTTEEKWYLVGVDPSAGWHPTREEWRALVAELPDKKHAYQPFNPADWTPEGTVYTYRPLWGQRSEGYVTNALDKCVPTRGFWSGFPRAEPPAPVKAATPEIHPIYAATYAAVIVRMAFDHNAQNSTPMTDEDYASGAPLAHAIAAQALTAQ